MATIEITPDVFERTDCSILPIPMHWTATGTTPRPPKDKAISRGYHSLGSATLPTRGRRGKSHDSKYGVMVSIKDIKGRPFVVLEDKGEQKHVVQAPENEPHPWPVSPTRLNGDSHKQEFDGVLSSSNMYPTLPVFTGSKGQITPSPVPRTRPADSMRESGRSKIRNNIKTRSRSLSPGRAAQERRGNRARSASPPHRNRCLHLVDSESIRPVNSLIGFFETGSPAPDHLTQLKPSKVDLIGPSAARPSRIHEVARKVNHESTVSSCVSSSVGTSFNSQGSNLAITVVDSTAKVSKKLDGRYFALTSPGPLTPKGTFTLPRLSSVQKPPDYSTLPASKTKSFQNLEAKQNTPLKAEVLPEMQYEKKQSSPVYNSAPSCSSSNPAIVREGLVVPAHVTRIEQPLPSFLSNLMSLPMQNSANEVPVEPIHVSKAKFMGPSQMLLKKTRRKRKARKLSTAVSESESEYSDAESLKFGNESYKDEEDEDSRNLNQEISQISVNLTQQTEISELGTVNQFRRSRTPSIKFEKIASEDVSKKVVKEDLNISILEEKKRSDSLEQDLERAHGKVIRLEKEIATLKEQLNTAQNELRMKNAENNLLKKEAASLKRTLAETPSSDEDKDSIMSLQRMLRSVKREKTALEETITLLESQKTTLKCQLQDARCEREDGEIQLRALRHEVGKLKEHTSEQEKDVDGIKRELARARRQTEAQIRDLEQQLTKAKKRSTDMKIENSALEKQLFDMTHDKLASANQDMQINETMRQLEQSKLKALQELEAAHAEIDEKARAFRDANRKNDKLQEELRRMDQDLEAELKERELTLEESRQADQKFRDLTSLYQVANREVEMLKKEVEIAKSKAKLAEKKLDELQNLIDEKDLKIDLLAKNNKTLHKQIEEDSISRLDLNRDLSNLDKDNQKLTDEISNLRQHLLETENKLMVNKYALDDVHKDLKKVSSDAEREHIKASELDKDVQIHRDEYNRMKAEFDQKELALKNAEEVVLKIKSQMSKIEESCSQAEKEKSMMEEDRDQVRREVERLTDQIDSQNQQMADADKTIDELREKLADDVKSRQDEITTMTKLKKECQGLQITVEEKAQQVYAAEETLRQQKEVIEEMNTIQQSTEKRALLEIEKCRAETEKQIGELKKELNTKHEEVKILESEKKELEEELDELEQQHPRYEDDREKEEELVNLSQKLLEEEEERRLISDELQDAHDKLGKALNEIEIEKSRVQGLLDEKEKYMADTKELTSSIRNLEDQFEQEAKELVNIKSHHMKTEQKLRDVLKQAQEETDKAVNEKEALAIHAERLEKQVENADRAAESAEASKLCMEREMKQLLEANFKLQQTLAALGIGHSSSNSEGSEALLTSV